MQPGTNPAQSADDLHTILSRFQTWTGNETESGSSSGKALPDDVREIPYDEALRQLRSRRAAQEARAALPKAAPAAALKTAEAGGTQGGGKTAAAAPKAAAEGTRKPTLAEALAAIAAAAPAAASVPAVKTAAAAAPAVPRASVAPAVAKLAGEPGAAPVPAAASASAPASAAIRASAAVPVAMAEPAPIALMVAPQAAATAGAEARARRASPPAVLKRARAVRLLRETRHKTAETVKKTVKEARPSAMVRKDAAVKRVVRAAAGTAAKGLNAAKAKSTNRTQTATEGGVRAKTEKAERPVKTGRTAVRVKTAKAPEPVAKRPEFRHVLAKSVEAGKEPVRPAGGSRPGKAARAARSEQARGARRPAAAAEKAKKAERETRVSVRLTDEEERWLQECAAVEGLTISAYLRKMALGKMTPGSEAPAAEEATPGKKAAAKDRGAAKASHWLEPAETEMAAAEPVAPRMAEDGTARAGKSVFGDWIALLRNRFLSSPVRFAERA